MQHIALYSWYEPQKSWAIEQYFTANLRKVKVASRYRAFSSGRDLFIRIVTLDSRCWLIVINEVKCYEVWMFIQLYIVELWAHSYQALWIYLLPISLTLSPDRYCSSDTEPFCLEQAECYRLQIYSKTGKGKSYGCAKEIGEPRRVTVRLPWRFWYQSY